MHEVAFREVRGGAPSDEWRRDRGGQGSARFECCVHGCHLLPRLPIAGTLVRRASASTSSTRIAAGLPRGEGALPQLHSDAELPFSSAATSLTCCR
jgi:hypothetical protein